MNRKAQLPAKVSILSLDTIYIQRYYFNKPVAFLFSEVITMQRFTNPRDLYHGKGALEALKGLEGKKAVICVGGGSMKRFGFLDRAKSYLEEAGMEVKIFEGIESDPSVETVMKGAAFMQEFEPDWIVAIGGGSPIDAAKAMWIKYEYPETTFEDMCKVFGLPKLRTKAHFCAVSSTSGTATEVTAFSIITDYAKGIKYPIADFQITPDVAIVDPELAETMPKKLVAHTGMDALTHAIEAYVSTVHSDFTDAPAIRAIEMIQRDLVDSSRQYAYRSVSCRHCLLFRTAWNRSLHGTQDRCSVRRLRRTHYPWRSQCHVSAEGNCFQCQE